MTTGQGRGVVVLLGGPGAGKGTQAKRIAASLEIPHISTGQLLRAAVAAGTPAGLEARAAVEAGQLVGDDLVNRMVADRIAEPDCSRGFILDGYPRDTGQAVALEGMLTRSDRQIVIDLVVDLDRILPRLTGRRTCPSCGGVYHVVTSPPRTEGRCDACGSGLVQRSDDREDVIRQRFSSYFQQTVPLTEFYRTRGVYHAIDGMRMPDQIAADIQQAVARLFDGHSPRHV